VRSRFAQFTGDLGIARPVLQSCNRSSANGRYISTWELRNLPGIEGRTLALYSRTAPCCVISFPTSGKPLDARLEGWSGVILHPLWLTRSAESRISSCKASESRNLTGEIDKIAADCNICQPNYYVELSFDRLRGGRITPHRPADSLATNYATATPTLAHACC